ncbi:hypothetical protein Back2_13720 [Nocardioides baekrokdamisoli]|uniref:D-inositol 3-phosphate glycosyltransferase n=1 Tax=Nocardioides baekrokdamisoli TaxID=1804624 RepID=A0A3G9IM47_9ACTN|nr:glycosyltransferase family 4 protein [Nocardioides baekrokdamisoli]BBH17085.1 hypothetical protein Back2_13720 [Nocardioides baekrokdamisoli]
MSRPRVTHVVATDAFAGVERYVCDTVTELHARGWQVTVIGGDPEAMRANLPAGVLQFPARTAAHAVRTLWRRPSDLVHTHMTAAEAAAAPLKGLRFQRLVSTRHLAQPRGSSPLGRLARPVIEARLDAQIAISEYAASVIVGPSIVVPNGVPSSRLAPLPRERTIVVMQRLESEKDTALAVQAYAASHLAEDGWALRICGRGAEEQPLRALARDLRIEVDFAGFVTDPRSVLASAGIVLGTAPAEPFGLAVVEAMAEAAPVVASDGGAHPEVLGPDGVYFPVGDVQAAAAALRTVAADEAYAAAYGRTLQRRHSELFTIERHVDRLEVVYEEAWNR